MSQNQENHFWQIQLKTTFLVLSAPYSFWFRMRIDRTTLLNPLKIIMTSSLIKSAIL